MSIRDLLNSLFSHKRIFALLVAISIVFCSAGLKLKESYTAEIIIKYICDSAKDGLTENGQQINPYEINSSLVVKNAVSALELKNTNIEAICRNITITPITPTAEQEKYASWIESFSDYEKNEDDKENTVYYSVKYTSSDGKDYAKRMLNSIISQYRLYYVEKYTYSSDITKLSGEAVMQYDYYETVDILRQKIKSDTEYLQSISSESNNYRSPYTGYSILDLAEEYNALSEQELSVCERMILENGITKDVAYLKSSLQNKATDAEYDINFNNKKAETQQGLMSVYSEKNKQYLWNNSENNGDDSESSQVRENVERDKVYSQDKSVYDNLILDYVKYKTDALNASIDKKRYESDRNAFSEDFSNIDTEKEIETRLENICERFNELYAVTKRTLDDYNFYKSSNSIKCVSGVVSHKSTSTMFYYVVCVVMALMIGAAISVLLGYMEKKENE